MDASAISALASARAEELCAQLLPGGRRDGRHYKAGSVAGEAGRSLVVDLDTGKWKDWASAEHHGDLIDLWRYSRGVSLPEAIRQVAAWCNVEHRPVGPRPAPRLRAQPTLQPASPAWSALQTTLRKGTIAELAALAALRGLPVFAGLEIATQRGQLFFADVFDDGFYWPAWILTDSSRINAQARRCDGKRWTKHDIKAKTIPGITGLNTSWPVGLCDVGSRGIALVEGGPDFLAAHHLIWSEGQTATLAPVAMFGSSHRIPDLALPAFSGKPVWIYPDADDAGRAAAELWKSQLEAIGCPVVVNDLSLDQAKDLNESLLTENVPM